MHSSSSDNESDAMFPSADNHSRAPRGGPLLDTSELSPPLSQEAPSQNDIEPMNIGQSQAPAQSPDAADGSRFPDQVPSKGPEKTVEPGYVWKNRKAREEYSRAAEQILDKNFNLSRLYKSNV